jgi:hypothetical protein
MGKAAKYKLIRKMAAKMPALNISVPVKETLTAKQLIDRGYKGDVAQGELYIHKTSRPAPANHERRMKQLYKKHGPAGIQAYATKVEQQEKNLTQ